MFLFCLPSWVLVFLYSLPSSSTSCIARGVCILPPTGSQLFGSCSCAVAGVCSVSVRVPRLVFTPDIHAFDVVEGRATMRRCTVWARLATSPHFCFLRGVLPLLFVSFLPHRPHFHAGSRLPTLLKLGMPSDLACRARHDLFLARTPLVCRTYSWLHAIGLGVRLDPWLLKMLLCAMIPGFCGL